MSSKLEALKIKECPFAFASFAEKHNALVDMLAAMTGQNGVTVVVSEKNAIIRGNGGGAAAISGNVANVVGSTGLLQNVYVGAAIANAYPAIGKWVMPAGNVVIDNTGITMTTSAGKTLSLAFASLSQNVAFRTEAYCNNNTQANIVIVGSSPF